MIWVSGHASFAGGSWTIVCTLSTTVAGEVIPSRASGRTPMTLANAAPWCDARRIG